MNLKKEILSLIFEIIVCFSIIIVGLYYWVNCDRGSLEVAKYYSNYSNIVVNIDDQNTVLSSNENDIKSNTLLLKNTSSKKSNVKLVIKIDRNNMLFKNNTVLKIDNNYYNLDDLGFKSDNNYMYIFINNYEFNSYETKEFEIKLLTKESINYNIYDYLNYEFMTQV